MQKQSRMTHYTEGEGREREREIEKEWEGGGSSSAIDLVISINDVLKRKDIKQAMCIFFF